MKKEKWDEKKLSRTFYPGDSSWEKGVIVALGPGDDNWLIHRGVKYFHALGCHVLAVTPPRPKGKFEGWHSVPLELYGGGISKMRDWGIRDIAVAGGSVTGLTALAAALYYPEISLVLAYTPGDFILEGFRRGGEKKWVEWPAKGESLLTFRGKPLPYSPYGVDDEEYNRRSVGNSSLRKGLDALPLFQGMEEHPDFFRGLLPVEEIRAQVHLFAAEDDSIWPSSRYLRRMERRVQGTAAEGNFHFHIFKKGTHFIFPQGFFPGKGMFAKFLVGAAFLSGRRYSQECEKTRKEVDRLTREALEKWTEKKGKDA